MFRVVVISIPLLLCHAFCLAQGTVAEGKVTKGPAPGWVVPHGSPFPESGKDEDGARHYLLIDVQRHAEEKATYEAFAIRVLSQAGVEDQSQLSVDFQPSYQSLVWHHLDVIRGGEKQDRLAVAEFELIRREEGMENMLYDGEITAHVILKDVRPGDIISYSFTTQGENPVLAGHTQGTWSMGYSIPVGRVRRSLIWNPAARTMAWKPKGMELKAREEELPGGLRRFSYERINPEKITAEKMTPVWIDDFPYVEFSDYQNWEDFGNWTAGIYGTRETLPPELMKVCDGIRREGGNSKEQALKVLRWNQANIRYLGSFFGEHTLAPYPLKEIAARRFGDCKDKGNLTVAMLRELGFDAAPALVDTDLQAAVAEMLPGHACFDHLIVHLSLDGKDYWLDPTRTFQRGSLDNLFSPDNGFAFVIRDGANALTAVKPSGFSEVGIETREAFDITDDVGNGTLTVTTVFSGWSADNMRRSFAEDGKAEMQKDFREHYAKDYPGIEIAAPLALADDDAANRITTVESYRLKAFLIAPETPGGEASGSVYARDIGNYITIPEARERKYPYEIRHPVRRSQTIELTTAKTWTIEAEEFSTELAAMKYHYSLKSKERTLVLRHEYKSLAGHVEPVDFAAYTKAMKEVDDKLYFGFDYPLKNNNVQSNEKPAVDQRQFTKSRVLLGVFLIVGLFIGGIVAIVLYFWDPRARDSTMLNPGGIGGWLVLPAIGCFVAPFLSIYVSSTYFTTIGEGDVNLFSGAEDQDLWRFYFGTGVVMEGFLFPLAVLQLVLLLGRRTSFTYIFVALALLNFGSGVLTFVLQSTVDVMDDGAKVGREIVTTLLRTVIWSVYMFTSQRVRATFIHRRKGVLPAPPPLPQVGV